VLPKSWTVTGSQPRPHTPPTPCTLQGVLTVHLVRCIGLHGEHPNTYCKIHVSDADTDYTQRSKLVGEGARVPAGVGERRVARVQSDTDSSSSSKQLGHA
jgi:hypothetical protein